MDNRQQEQEEQQQWLVYEKLQKARVKLQSLKLKKSGYNSYADFKYFELGDFLPSVNTIFAEIALCSVFSIHDNEAMLYIIDPETGGQIVFRSPLADAATGKAPPIQALGSQHTYLRRYLFLNALEITEHDAVDPMIRKDEPKKASTKSVPQDVFDSLDETSQEELRSYAADVIIMLSKEKVADAVAYLESLNLDEQWKIAIWHLFDSKQRSAIKKFTKG
jgi:hypothetical protein